MYGFLSVLILLVCVILTLVVLVQNSKGGGLASNFAGSNQVMGVRKTADFLEKSTWTLAGILLVLSVLASMAIPKSETVQQSKVSTQIENYEGPISPEMVPTLPADLPQEDTDE